MPASSINGKYVSIVPAQAANFFLLDSLDHTNTAPGRLGDEQLHWLDIALGSQSDKPAIVFGHHPIHLGGLMGFFGGMRDGEALWRVIDRHAHVVAYVFGHTHRWEITSRKNIHLVNLPSTAYVFDRDRPRGWVEMLLGNDGAQFLFHSIPGTEPSKHWQREARLKWRT